MVVVLFTRLLFLSVPLLFFQTFQTPSSEFHKKFMSKDLRDFRLGTVVSNDYETPLTAAKSAGSGGMRPDKEKWERVSPKDEMANNMVSNDSRSVPPKGSVLLQRCDTKRSVADQTCGLR